MKIVAVSGTIGTGKTTLCDALANITGWKVVRENARDNPFLHLFYENMDRWALASQLSFMTTKTKDFLSCVKLSPNIVLIDRTIQEDFHVFASVLEKYNIMSIEEHRLLACLYEFLLAQWQKIDLTLYLEDTDENCFQRLLNRGDPAESKIEIGYVRSVGKQYRKWRKDSLSGPHLELNPERCDFREINNVLTIVENIRAMLDEDSGKQP